MSSTQVILYLFALFSIYALAAALDEHDAQSVLRLAAQVKVAGCTRAASRHGEPFPGAATAPASSVLAC